MRRLPLILPIIALLSACSFGEAARKQAAYHYQMGLSYLAEKNIPGALQELTAAETINPEDADVLNNLGLAYFYRKKFELAEQKFLKAIAVRPAFSDARNNLGVTYLEMKRWDDAIRQFSFVSEDIFYPKPEDAGINLGLAYLGKGDHSTAVAILRKVIAAAPENPVARVTLGRVYHAAGKSVLAVEQYQEALRIFGDYAAAHFYLGIAYTKDNETEKARKSFQEVLRIAPSSELGQLSREYLESLK